MFEVREKLVEGLSAELADVTRLGAPERTLPLLRSDAPLNKALVTLTSSPVQPEASARHNSELPVARTMASDTSDL